MKHHFIPVSGIMLNFSFELANAFGNTLLRSHIVYSVTHDRHLQLLVNNTKLPFMYFCCTGLTDVYSTRLEPRLTLCLVVRFQFHTCMHVLSLYLISAIIVKKIIVHDL